MKLKHLLSERLANFRNAGFQPEDGGSMSLRNIGVQPEDYTT
jgi:hypothetical protein